MEAEEFEERLPAPLKGKTEKRREALNLLLERLSAYHPLRYLGREKSVWRASRTVFSGLFPAKGRPWPGEFELFSRDSSPLPHRPVEEASLPGGPSGRLEDLSYRRVPERGFALALKEGRPLLDASEARAGDPLRIVLSRGELIAEVKKIKEETLGQEG